MRVGVTGASGFIGKLLCQALLARGDQVVVLSRRDEQNIAGTIVCRGDLTAGSQNLSAFVEGLEVIYHCAGELKNQALMYSLHVEGTRALLAAACASIQRTGRALHWVQLSSVGAYGAGKRAANELRLVDESCHPQPVGEYEVTKTLADESLLAASAIEPRLSYTLVRPSIVIGASMPNQSFFQFANAVRRRLFFYIGSQDAVSTYIHVDDVVEALLNCSSREAARNETFILSNDCRQRELVEAIAAHYGVKPPAMVVPECFLRWIIRLLPAGRSPLTSERVDALVRRTRYVSDHAAHVLGFKPAALPAQLAAVLKTY
ncbi:NAD-dependent epimerase/dehydratase family protein [Pseudomonas sp. PCH44]|uniref:NAD-dependent epimerase/dehydratase family protein n=1 Tax=Pseudomonas sp. PCH44 TaxID=2800904 RepID=UPI001BB0D05F|nr:NAD-dependent epimerase/dehydratase family protein [Pseudomonas sp. PCH44]MBS3186414.1 NAD-dependent epimerase/dehydratase family protein [Pseudomonas sp. PCH44]